MDRRLNPGRVSVVSMPHCFVGNGVSSSTGCGCNLPQTNRSSYPSRVVVPTTRLGPKRHSREANRGCCQHIVTRSVPRTSDHDPVPLSFLKPLYSYPEAKERSQRVRGTGGARQFTRSNGSAPSSRHIIIVAAVLNQSIMHEYRGHARLNLADCMRHCKDDPTGLPLHC